MFGLIKQVTGIFQLHRRVPEVPVIYTPSFPELAKGTARHFRDVVTFAPWLVSFNKNTGAYYCQPVGNTRLLRAPYVCYELDKRLVPSGTGIH